MTNIKEILSNELETTLNLYLRDREVGYRNGSIQFNADAPNFKIEYVIFQWDEIIEHVWQGLDFDVVKVPTYKIMVGIVGLGTPTLKEYVKISLNDIKDLK